MVEVNNLIKKKFPFITYCIWESGIVKNFTQHFSKNDFLLIDVERDVAESVYYTLSEKYKKVFFLPDLMLLNNFISGYGKAMIVRYLTTEAPIQEVKGVPTTTIEKLLVDVYCDSEFDFLKGRETRHVYENALSSYTVNRDRLLRYARRKGEMREVNISYLLDTVTKQRQ